MPCPNSARRRSKTMAFRMTPEEYEEVISLAKLSGMNGRDFIMSRLRGVGITVKPSTRVYKALKDSMEKITCSSSGSAQEASWTPQWRKLSDCWRSSLTALRQLQTPPAISTENTKVFGILRDTRVSVGRDKVPSYSS